MQASMKIWGVSCLVLLAVAAGPVQGQERRGGFGFGFGANVASVAAVPAVADELKLTDQQKTMVNEMAAQAREGMRGGGDLSPEERRERFQKMNEQRQANEKKLAEALGAEKFQRLQQLTLQVSGPMAAFMNRELSEKLDITEDQRQQARDLMSDMRGQFDPDATPEARAKNREQMNEKYAAILTDEQKSKWKEMLGTPASDELLAQIRSSMRPGGGRRQSQN